MRKCTKCGAMLSLDQFSPNGGGRRYTQCRDCRAAQARALRAKRRANDICVSCGKPSRPGKCHCAICAADQVRQKVVAYKTRAKVAKAKMVEYKGGKCQDCGLVTPYLTVYEFHHRGLSKKRAVAELRSKKRSWNTIKRELDVCDLVCANCHRIRHELLGLKQEEEVLEHDQLYASVRAS